MYLHLPTEEQKENARRTFNATKESVKRDVQHLIEWFDKQPHLPTITDEELLAHCLFNCKNSLEKTKYRLELYFNTKTIMPEIFRNRDPFSQEIERVCSLGMYVPLPKLTHDGYRVLFLYISDAAKTMKPSPFNHFLKASFMTVDILGKYDYPKGVIIVHDGKNLTMPFVVAAASELHKLIILGTRNIPVRYRNIYFMNMNPAVEMLISIGKNLLSKELASRMRILEQETDICEVLPMEVIPKDYGGTELPALETLKNQWYDEIKRHKEFLLNTENFMSDLSKKPASSLSADIYGMNGSFRTMNID